MERTHSIHYLNWISQVRKKMDFERDIPSLERFVGGKKSFYQTSVVVIESTVRVDDLIRSSCIK